MVVVNVKERESSKKAWDILVTQGWGKCTLRYQRLVCAREMDQLHFIETETYRSGKMAPKRVNRQVYRRETQISQSTLYRESICLQILPPSDRPLIMVCTLLCLQSGVPLSIRLHRELLLSHRPTWKCALLVMLFLSLPKSTQNCPPANPGKQCSPKFQEYHGHLCCW